ncbi:MAG: undecaprenyl diphosphate synthase family protein, partial [Aeriscardovia sp.]|nr:undecaprenyl diphosphate synthase family protein [Aeriscardovia sp.]
EKSFASHLYNSDIPDLDLIMRSSGEKRLSNFMLWQSAYAELDFEPELWPDCGRKVLWRAIDAYCRRSRRFGGVESA